jgi:putative ABC transport system ATP-binding protein
MPVSRIGSSSKELSGGQQQRVAIARALINDPAILLCDEPTGNLDQATGRLIMDMLLEVNRRGKTIIMVTHDADIAAYAGRTITIVDGKVA